MADPDMPLASLGHKRSLASTDTGGQQKKKAYRAADLPAHKGGRPRFDEDPPKVVDCLLSYTVEKDPPHQTEKVPNSESREIKKLLEEARAKGEADTIPIAKANRDSVVWVGKMRGESGGVYTTNPELLERSPKYEDGLNTCDICGKACGELFMFRAFKRLLPLGEDSSHLDRIERAERRLYPFISYVGMRCGQNLLGKPTPLSEALDYIISELDKSNDSEPALASIMDYICGLPEQKAKLYRDAIATLAKRAMKKHKLQREEAGGPLLPLRLQARQLAGPSFSGYAKEDRAIDPTRTTTEYVSKTLWNLSWPICYSRQNVTPDGQAYIYAFPVGLVQNYCYGPQCSSSLQRFPNLAELLVQWFRQTHPGFAFTTIQLNRNYAAKLHVDGNNLGPSKIIGLPGPGGYTGGDLWILDETIDDSDPACKYMEVSTHLKGWPELKGKTVKGRLVSIKNEWFTFDGTIPHCVLPFEGSRISIVFFCRNNHASVPDHVRLRLEDKGFCWPDKNLPGGFKLEAIHGEKKDSKVVLTGKGKTTRVEEVSSDEENDEEDDGAFVPPMEDWCSVFLKSFNIRRLQQQQKEETELKPLSLVTAHLGVSAFFGLRELLGTEKLNTIATLELKRDASRSILRKAAQPKKLDVGNKISPKVLEGEIQDIYCGGFLMLPFLTRTKDKEGKPFYESDINFEQFKQIREHVREHKPKAALIVPDMRGIPAQEVRATCRCVLKELDCLLTDYSMEICQVDATSFGIPLHEAFVMLVLIRQGTTRTASDALAVVHYIAKQQFLPLTHVQDFVFPEGQRSSLLEDTWKSWKLGANARKEKDNLHKRTRKLVAEAQEAGVDKEAEQMKEDWLANAFNTEKWKALLVKKRAMEEAKADEKMLIIDVWAKEDSWDDKGFLPRSAGNAWHYLVGQERMLSGVEHLALRGVPARRVPEVVRWNTDESLVTLACRTVPVPILGAALFGIMVTSELGEVRGLVLEDSTWADVRAAIPTGSQHITRASLQKLSPDEVTQGIDGRAMQLGWLLNHAGFKAEEKEKKRKQRGEKVDDNKGTDPNDNDAAMTDVDSDGSSSSDLSSSSSSEFPEEDLQEDWEKRCDSLRMENRPPNKKPAPMGAAVVYIRDALASLEESVPDGNAVQIVVYGLDYIRRELLRFWDKGRLPDMEVRLPSSLTKAFPSIEATARTNLKKLPKDSSQELDFLVGLFKACMMQVAWRHKKGGFCLENADRWSLPRYSIKAKVLHPLEKIVILRNALSGKGSRAEDFMNAVGKDLVPVFLEEAGTAIATEIGEVATSQEFTSLLLKYIKLPEVLTAMFRFHTIPGLTKQEPTVNKLTKELIEAGCTSISRCLGGEGSDEDREIHLQNLKKFSKVTEGDNPFTFAMQTIHSCQHGLPHSPRMDRIRKLHVLRTNALNNSKTLDYGPWTKLFSAMEKALAARIKNEEEVANQEMQKQREEQKEKEERLQQQMVQKAEQKLRANIGKVDSQLQILQSKPSKREDAERELRALAHILAHEVFNFEGGSDQAFRNKIIDNCCRSRVDSIYATAQEAAEWPARLQKVRRWLCWEGFEAILPTLSARFDAGSQSFVEKLAGSIPPTAPVPVGLPRSMSDSLMNKLSALPQDLFQAGKLPDGWQCRSSASSGMSVYTTQGGESQLAFPVEPDLANEWPVDEPALTGSPREGIAPYIYVGSPDVSNISCALCADTTGWLHLQTKNHKLHVEIWAICLSVAKDVKSELQSLSLKPRVEGLGAVWQHHLREQLQEKIQATSNGGDPTQTFRTFWHRCVLPCWEAAEALNHSSHVIAVLEKIAKWASLAEPMPRPGVDFVYLPKRGEVFAAFTEDDNSLQLDKAQVSDFLGDGLKPRPTNAADGSEVVLECQLCSHQLSLDAKVAETKNLAQHLLPHYRDCKIHQKHLLLQHQWQAKLRENWWQLQRNGIILKGNMFHCLVCKGGTVTEDALSSFEHIETHNHKASIRKHYGEDVETMLARSPAKNEIESWEESFREADRLHEQTLNSPAFNDAVVKLKQAVAPPAGAAATPGAVRSADPPTAEPCRPGYDFPCWPTSNQALDWANAELDDVRRRSADLWQEESIFEVGPQQYWCDFCETLVAEDMLLQHLRSSKSKGERHNDYKAAAVKAVAELKTRGWVLESLGIVLSRRDRRASTFNCPVCRKADGAWYQALEHLDNKRHKAHVERVDGDPEAKRKAEGFATRIDEMMKEMREGVGCPLGQHLGARRIAAPPPAAPAAAAAASSSSSAPQVVPGTARAGSAAAPAAAAPAQDHADRPDNLPRVTRAETIQESWGLPTDDEVETAKEQAKVGYPPLPQGLRYARFVKKKGLHIECEACKVLVGHVKYDQSSGRLTHDEHGQCPHYTADVKQKLVRETQRMWNEWNTQAPAAKRRR